MNCLPSQAITRNSSSSVISCVVTSGYAVTICCSGARSALFLNSKSPMARDKARLPFTRPKSTNPPAALIRAFSPEHCRQNMRLSPGKTSHTFVLRLVVKRQRLCASLNSENGPRVSGIGLDAFFFSFLLLSQTVRSKTHHPDLIAGDHSYRCRASRDFLFVFGIYSVQ